MKSEDNIHWLTYSSSANHQTKCYDCHSSLTRLPLNTLIVVLTQLNSYSHQRLLLSEPSLLSHELLSWTNGRCFEISCPLFLIPPVVCHMTNLVLASFCQFFSCDHVTTSAPESSQFTLLLHQRYTTSCSSPVMLYSQWRVSYSSATVQ